MNLPTDRVTDNDMKIWEQAQPLEGWHMVKDGIPEPGTEVEILHFGSWPDSQIYDTATVDKWGICPHAKDGGHGKRSTVTHWRVSSNAEIKGGCAKRRLERLFRRRGSTDAQIQRPKRQWLSADR